MALKFADVGLVLDLLLRQLPFKTQSTTPSFFIGDEAWLGLTVSTTGNDFRVNFVGLGQIT
jgi:hypothetical protein